LGIALEAEKNWKLKLRYGKLQTPFQHFTMMAEGEIVETNADFDIQVGTPAFFRMNVWALDPEQAVDMIITIGRHIGFETTGRVYTYSTEAKEPPNENPRAYDLNFTPFEKD
jgi:hypothetical protein